MRLSTQERDVIRQSAQECFDSDVVVRLFGSRLDDSRKGGDIDLLIETHLTNPVDIVKAHHRFVSCIYSKLGEQKIDVLIDYPSKVPELPVYRLAREQGLVL